MAAMAGYPHLTLPMGEIRGLPIGLSVMGATDQDAAVLSGGLAIERVLGLSPTPALLPSAAQHPKIQPSVEGTA